MIKITLKDNSILEVEKGTTIIGVAEKISDGVYRVDFDLYKNLFRVFSEEQGDILHTMCSNLNGFYHKVSGCDLGQYQPKTDQKNADGSFDKDDAAKISNAVFDFLKMTCLEVLVAVSEVR